MTADDGPGSNSGTYIALEFALARKAARQQNDCSQSAPFLNAVDRYAPGEHVVDELGCNVEVPEDET